MLSAECSVLSAVSSSATQHPALSTSSVPRDPREEPAKTSAAPLKESFSRWANLKIVLLVLLGATAGVMKIDIVKSSLIVAIALFLGMPFFTVFGSSARSG